MRQRIVSWFSCGAASAVATKLAISQAPGPVEIAYCETGSEHPDNERFFADCEHWFGQAITRLKSEKYVDTWDVWERRRYLAGISGAPCTVEMKVSPRLLFQRPTDIHAFGYTADAADRQRANRFWDTYPELTMMAPLIGHELDKAACLSIVQGAGIALPVMYGLGFHNNNCLPCVKATSPAYWALFREHFPDKFERMAKLSRSLGTRLCRIKNVRRFIDEIPLDHPTTNPIAPACDFLCHVAEQEMAT